MKAIIVLAMSLVAVNSFAAEKTLPAQCTAIAEQCKTAGFMPGDHKKTGKGLWVDCVQAVAKGKPVTGVTATQADAEACVAAHKETKKDHATH